MKTSNTVAAVALCIGFCQAQGPPEGGDPYAGGTQFLDHDSLINSFPGQSFLRYNIPFIDLPDKNIQDVFHYRWSALARHLRYAAQGVGHVVTEFIQPVFWAGSFSTIDAAAGHHINEIRWLRDKSYLENYVDVWTKGPATGTSYTHWIQEAALASANVTGHADFSATQLDGFVRMFREWDHTFDSTIGLYYYNTLLDAQEFSLPGYVADAAVNNTNPDVLFNGPDTFRPSLNAYMIAAAKAITSLASTIGRQDVAAEFASKVSQLETSFFAALWNDDIDFFVDNIRQGIPGAGKLDGREAVGLYPFRFGIANEEKYWKPALQVLFDTQGFRSEHFPTTLEMRNKYFTRELPGDGCCYWQGQNWPFTTSHVLYSLEKMTREGLATAGQYLELLSNYATVQHKNGIPYIAEEHYPFGPDWSSDGGNYSEHYAHSTFNDNVITGILGLIPRSDDVLEISPLTPSNWSYFALENVVYHDRLITVLYDRDGSRYRAGSGLTVFVDGAKVYTGAEPSAKFDLPKASTTPATPAARMANVAANPLIAEGVGAWPRISATYSHDDNGPEKAIDGLMYYDQLPTNRWTNVVDGGPARADDTLIVTLQRQRQVTSVSLGVYVNNDDGVACPSRIKITDHTGRVVGRDDAFASHCRANDLNTITFNQSTTTNKIAVHLYGQSGKAVGLTELQIWVPVNEGPTYYAADALPLIAKGVGYDGVPSKISFDGNSKATSNGAVMALSQPGAVATFAGVHANSTGLQDLKLTYRNSGSSAETLTIQVNRETHGSVSLPTTGKAYQSVTISGLPLLKGKNYVALSSSGRSVSLETLTT